MKFHGMIGKYKMGPTIGEGAFAKVRLAKNMDNNGQQVAVKIIDKKMVIHNKLIHQVQREIRTMKLLKHPNIVRIHEVLGSKTKIYIVMEYVSGDQLADKLSSVTKLDEDEARKLFQQLIDAVEYCHSRGVYHRDLKPQNLLLDSKGNLKISDFGLSALSKLQPGCLLLTTCGSPSYVAPELIRNRGYEGATVDVWACGVILFEILSGYMPFDDQSLSKLYKKILEAEYKTPEWFTASQKSLLSRIFQSDPHQRITIPEIIEDEWFQTDYKPAVLEDFSEQVSSNDGQPAFVSVEEAAMDVVVNSSSGFINAFQLIAMSKDLSLSGLFEEKDDDKHRIMLGSKHTITETMQRIEAAAKDSCLLVERMNNSKIKMQEPRKIKASRSCVNLMAEVIEVSPTDCVVQVSKSAGELRMYQEFCTSLTNLLEKRSRQLTKMISKDDTHIQLASSKSVEKAGFRGYLSS